MKKTISNKLFGEKNNVIEMASKDRTEKERPSKPPENRTNRPVMRKE